MTFNNFRDCFPSGPVGRIPAFDADVSDQLHYRILSGNNANLVHLNSSSGEITLSPQLNTNVPKLATMEVSVTGRYIILRTNNIILMEWFRYVTE